MRLPVRRALSIGALAVALGGIGATTANAAPAAASVTACHTNAYQVKDSSGNYVQAIDSLFDLKGNFAGYIAVELWYCPDYQSNFARAEFVPAEGNLQPVGVDLVVRGQSGNGASAFHYLYPGVNSQDGSQDSPAYYAPVEPAQACVYLAGLNPYTDEDGGSVCTEFV